MVSFDFDSCLSGKNVQEYASELILRGFEIWVCTSRLSPENATTKEWNDDLFEVTDRLGIPRERIIFTNYTDKYELLDDKFKVHLDDDSYELKLINKHTDIVGISVWGNSVWKRKSDRILAKYSDL
jgi:hypothetical protein